MRSQQLARTLRGENFRVKRRAQGQPVDESRELLGLDLSVEPRAQDPAGRHALNDPSHEITGTAYRSFEDVSEFRGRSRLLLEGQPHDLLPAPGLIQRQQLGEEVDRHLFGLIVIDAPSVELGKHVGQS